MCTVAEDAAGDWWLLPWAVARMCRVRQLEAAWIAPAEPPASGEAQCADGEGLAAKGQCSMARTGAR